MLHFDEPSKNMSMLSIICTHIHHHPTIGLLCSTELKTILVIHLNLLASQITILRTLLITVQ